MDFSAAHTGFVVVSYGLSFLVLAGLTAAILLKDRARSRELDQRKHRDGA
jgi:heme exporter protein CcmD